MVASIVVPLKVCPQVIAVALQTKSFAGGGGQAPDVKLLLVAVSEDVELQLVEEYTVK